MVGDEGDVLHLIFYYIHDFHIKIKVFCVKICNIFKILLEVINSVVDKGCQAYLSKATPATIRYQVRNEGKGQV